MQSPDAVTASALIIGNEILSGRTPDTNLNHLAVTLGGWGIQLREVRVIPDVEAEIVAAVNECRRRFNYVFTTGGIGLAPTRRLAEGGTQMVALSRQPEKADDELPKFVQLERVDVLDRAGLAAAFALPALWLNPLTLVLAVLLLGGRRPCWACWRWPAFLGPICSGGLRTSSSIRPSPEFAS